MIVIFFRNRDCKINFDFRLLKKPLAASASVIPRTLTINWTFSSFWTSPHPSVTKISTRWKTSSSIFFSSPTWVRPEFGSDWLPTIENHNSDFIWTRWPIIKWLSTPSTLSFTKVTFWTFEITIIFRNFDPTKRLLQVRARKNDCWDYDYSLGPLFCKGSPYLVRFSGLKITK